MGHITHKYRLKYGVVKTNSQKLEVVLTKEACTSLMQLLCTYRFFDVSSITSSHNNVTKSIQLSQGSGKITSPKDL